MVQEKKAISSEDKVLRISRRILSAVKHIYLVQICSSRPVDLFDFQINSNFKRIT